MEQSVWGSGRFNLSSLNELASAAKISQVASGKSMSKSTAIETISTSGAPAPAGHYSQALAHGGLVFVAGQLPIKPDGTQLTKEPIEVQARQALSNMLAILKEAGCSPSDVLKVTVYIQGIEHWPAFNGIYSELFGEARPARSVVPVPALHFGFLVEVDAIAARPD